MAMSNRDLVGKGLDYLREGLFDLVDPILTEEFGTADWDEAWAKEDARKHGTAVRKTSKNDVAIQLRAITERGRAFNAELSRPQQAYASELRETRNQWAHGESFSSDDAVRALDTMERLLRAADAADSADDVRSLRQQLQQRVVSEQQRNQRRHPPTAARVSDLPAWRELIRPHEDVARGDFNASEFAADLHRVAHGSGAGVEYADPVEFFRRTYPTDGLTELLTTALKRLSGDPNAAPVINLQTNFGGGKTHSMLALYHLLSRTPSADLPQAFQEIVTGVLGPAANVDGEDKLARLNVRRVALVGTQMQPGSVSCKPDGTEVRTMWGELAWQLGGREAYEIVADADRTATNPGEALTQLLQRYSPALILIDEWVAYARQLLSPRGGAELPAGSFETQFSFAQTLTEAAAAVPGVFLVISVPASDDGRAQPGQDEEVGGENGQAALANLLNVVNRKASQWRPSSAQESFEIVRQRLFQDPDPDATLRIGNVIREFITLYRKNPERFPGEASDPSSGYERRMRATYPLHPELLDRLHNDWSALPHFQNTRGMLRLMSTIVHRLWIDQDSSPLIMPGTLPLADSMVAADLTAYLPSGWKPILEADVDGESSTAWEIDASKPQLGQHATTRRLARSVFFDSAPRSGSDRKGADQAIVWLGSAVPKDNLGNFGAAIEELERRSHHFYSDMGQYWFGTQPSVTKRANDYAERLRQETETVWQFVTDELKRTLRTRHLPFAAVHVAPVDGAEVPDTDDLRLVVVPPHHATGPREGHGSPAYEYARDVVETAGRSQRTYRNRLVFLAADRTELGTLEGAVRDLLAWRKVDEEKDDLDLTNQQLKQITSRITQLKDVVADRIERTWAWVLYPSQDTASEKWSIEASKVNAPGDSITSRCAAKLDREGQLADQLNPGVLGQLMHEDLRQAWMAQNHRTVKEIWEWFAQYPYLPRLTGRHVLEHAIEDAPHVPMASYEAFAIAERWDQEKGRYLGLVVPPAPGEHIVVSESTLLVHMDVAQRQEEKDRTQVPPELVHGLNGGNADGHEGVAESREGDAEEAGDGKSGDGAVPPVPQVRQTQMGASIVLPADRPVPPMGDLSQEVLANLLAAGADVHVTVEIQASLPEGFSEQTVRTVRENLNALGASSATFW